MPPRPGVSGVRRCVLYWRARWATSPSGAWASSGRPSGVGSTAPRTPGPPEPSTGRRSSAAPAT
eukprot:901364-Karenia_brevis.AAC.1